MFKLLEIPKSTRVLDSSLLDVKIRPTVPVPAHGGRVRTYLVPQRRQFCCNIHIACQRRVHMRDVQDCKGHCGTGSRREALQAMSSLSSSRRFSRSWLNTYPQAQTSRRGFLRVEKVNYHRSLAHKDIIQVCLKYFVPNEELPFAKMVQDSYVNPRVPFAKLINREWKTTIFCEENL